MPDSCETRAFHVVPCEQTLVVAADLRFKISFRMGTVEDVQVQIALIFIGRLLLHSGRPVKNVLGCARTF